MKTSEIEVGRTYYRSQRYGKMARSVWRRVVSMTRKSDDEVVVMWKGLGGYGRHEGTTRLVTFARWAQCRTNAVQDGDKHS